MSKVAIERIEKFLDERSSMQGVDQVEVAAVHRGDAAREAVLTTVDLRDLLIKSQRMRDALSLLRVNSSLSTHQLEIVNGALAD